jgi:hypothetical protein
MCVVRFLSIEQVLRIPPRFSGYSSVRNDWFKLAQPSFLILKWIFVLWFHYVQCKFDFLKSCHLVAEKLGFNHLVSTRVAWNELLRVAEEIIANILRGFLAAIR